MSTTDTRDDDLAALEAEPIALDMLPELEKEARARQAHGQTAPGRTLSELIPEAFWATSQAARMFNTLFLMQLGALFAAVFAGLLVAFVELIRGEICQSWSIAP